MGGILGAVSLIQTALGVIGSFKGSAQAAKVTGYVTDAVSVVSALTPLVQQFGNGKEVTEEDVRAALAGMDAALNEFEATIKAKGG